MGASFNHFRNLGSVPDGAESGLRTDASDSRRRFAAFAWSLLVLNLAAVAWGVFLRAGKFGDGCGTNWPLCPGGPVPLNGSISRFIEGSHRLMTSLIGVMTIGLVFWSRRIYSREDEGGRAVRGLALAALGMTVVEGLVGAVLVKFALVTTNASPMRALVMAFHVVSTFGLVGAVAACALAAGPDGDLEGGVRPRLKQGGAALGMLLTGAIGLVGLGATGAISAFAHQVNPVEDVLTAALAPGAPWMVRLQPMHPLLSAAVALYLVLMAGLLPNLRPDPRVALWARRLAIMVGVEMALGLVNILVRAAIPMQMLHLVAADLTWVALVGLGVAALHEGVPRAEGIRDEGFAPLRGKAAFSAYLALTKPRIISLLLFTTLTAAIAAAQGWPGGWTMLALFVGGYAAAGAANAINMVVDRDIDGRMARTAARPTVTRAISSGSALLFAGALALVSFASLWAGGTLLAAVLALAGLVFYVVVYTLFLKRRTWHNIVIGGAAGAFPPLVGWAGVTGTLPPLALWLFAIVFVWTPVHFWALAMLIRDDYAAAGVPMLPVVRGDRATVRQIGIYTVFTVLATFAPLLQPRVGWLYFLAAVALNAYLVVLYVGLARRIERPRASKLFHYSMLYLALLFLALALDRSVLYAPIGGRAAEAQRVQSERRYHHLGEGSVTGVKPSARLLSLKTEGAHGRADL